MRLRRIEVVTRVLALVLLLSAEGALFCVASYKSGRVFRQRHPPIKNYFLKEKYPLCETSNSLKVTKYL